MEEQGERIRTQYIAHCTSPIMVLGEKAGPTSRTCGWHSDIKNTDAEASQTLSVHFESAHSGIPSESRQGWVQTVIPVTR